MKAWLQLRRAAGVTALRVWPAAAVCSTAELHHHCRQTVHTSCIHFYSLAYLTFYRAGTAVTTPAFRTEHPLRLQCSDPGLPSSQPAAVIPVLVQSFPHTIFTQSLHIVAPWSTRESNSFEHFYSKIILRITYYWKIP